MFAELLPEAKFAWRGEPAKCACSANKLMAETIVIEKSMQIGAEDTRIGTRASVSIELR
jgi:hypothetical protein